MNLQSISLNKACMYVVDHYRKTVRDDFPPIKTLCIINFSMLVSTLFLLFRGHRGGQRKPSHHPPGLKYIQKILRGGGNLDKLKFSGKKALFLGVGSSAKKGMLGDRGGGSVNPPPISPPLLYVTYVHLLI